MADGKRYYWLKLKDDFFESKRIKKLRNMAGGATYIIIYLKMQLKAMKTEGVLTWTGLEKSPAEELALDLDESPDDVEIVLAYLLQTGLVESEDNVNFFLPYAIENTGSEVASTIRSRECRARQKMLQCNNNATELQQNCNGEKETEKELESDIEKEREKKTKSAPQRHQYGSCKNVLLSDDDMEKLKAEFPFDYEDRIESVSLYCASHGKEYKNYLQAIRNWARMDEERRQQKGGPF